jgi:hypothetical protein
MIESTKASLTTLSGLIGLNLLSLIPKKAVASFFRNPLDEDVAPILR